MYTWILQDRICEDVVGYVASQQINHRILQFLWVCALSGAGGSVCVWSCDPGHAQVPGLGVWLWRSITADWTWYVPHSSSCKELFFIHAIWFLQCTPCFHTSRHSPSSTHHPMQRHTEASAACADWTLMFTLWIAVAKQHRHMSRIW